MLGVTTKLKLTIILAVTLALSACKEDQQEINKVIDIVQSYKQYFHSLHITQNTVNKGCAQQTIDCMNKFCKTHERFIFLEDDNIVSPFFLDFMNQALIKYEKT